MMICFPTTGPRGLEEKVGNFIRLVPTYTILDNETGAIRILHNNHGWGEGPEALPYALARAEVDVLIVRNIDRASADLFENEGIVVYRGACGTVGEALKMFEKHQLEPVTKEHVCTEYTYLDELNRVLYEW